MIVGNEIFAKSEFQFATFLRFSLIQEMIEEDWATTFAQKSICDARSYPKCIYKGLICAQRCLIAKTIIYFGLNYS